MRAATSSASVVGCVAALAVGQAVGVPSMRRTISPRMEGRARRVGEEFGGGAAEELFVELGELAGEDDALVRAEEVDDVGEGVEDAVRGFVEDVGGGFGGVGDGALRRASRVVRRWPSLLGRKPWKAKRSAGRPLAMRALSAALAPGMG